MALQCLKLARVFEAELVVDQSRSAMPSFRRSYREEVGVLAGVLGGRHEVEEERAAVAPSPCSSVADDPCPMPLPDWLNHEGSNRALVTITFHGPNEDQIVQFTGVAFFDFPLRVDRDDWGNAAEWGPNGEVAYSPRRGAGTWVEVPVAVDHDDPFADRIAIAFPEKMWDELFPAPVGEGEGVAEQ